MKRLGIFLVYDDQAIVDRYIGYYLKELKTCVSTLVVVCNMEKIRRGEEILREHADQIYLRKNIGFDAGGFKDALCSYLGWDTVREYDELVLANDSTIGPFRPMREIFEEMDARPLDFWGLTSYVLEGSIPSHIQSYFLVIRTRMLHCREFQEYWESLPYFKDFPSVVEQYEEQFTKHFSDLGYTYGVLADISANDSEDNRTNYSQYPRIPYELTVKRNFPFFKKAIIMHPDLFDAQTQQEFRMLVNYIDRETDYDIDLLWENAVRRFNMLDMYRIFRFNYILSPSQKPLSSQTAILAFVSHAASPESVLPHLEGLRATCLVTVCAGEERFLEEYRRLGYACALVSQEEYLTFLAGYADYDCVCIIHDVDLTPGALCNAIPNRECAEKLRFNYIAKSYFYAIWENLLKHPGHVSAIQNLLKEEPRLGCLAAPPVMFGPFFSETGRDWEKLCPRVQHIAEKLGLSCRISYTHPPIRAAEDVWVRGPVLARLRDMDPGDAPLLPYLWTYLAQDAGYYSGIVQSPEYASMNGANLQEQLDRILGLVRTQYGDFTDLPIMQIMLNQPLLDQFCANHSPLYVYGTGYLAKFFRKTIPGKAGYIISDGQPKSESFFGYPVLYLSELELPAEGGVILCLNEANQQAVLPLLEAKGIKNIFCLQFRA